MQQGRRVALQYLATRADQGDVLAAAQLRQGLERQLPRLVRHAMRHRDQSPALAWHIAAQADDQAAYSQQTSHARAGLVRRVAQRVRELIMDKLGRVHCDLRGCETVRA